MPAVQYKSIAADTCFLNIITPGQHWINKGSTPIGRMHEYWSKAITQPASHTVTVIIAEQLDFNGFI